MPSLSHRSLHCVAPNLWLFLPSHKYKTLASAVKASETYAEQRPTTTFEVLQCVAISSTPKPLATTFYLDKALNNIPTD